MPRLKRTDKRKHEMTLEARCVLANMHAGCAPRALWERFWRGHAEGQAAFDALRERCRGDRALDARDGEPYEAWLDRVKTEADEKWRGDEERLAAQGLIEEGDDPDPDGNAPPWRR